MTDHEQGLCSPDQIPDAKDLANAFKALGDMNRLRIISLLASDSTGTLGVSDLAAILGITQPAVSQHLKVLKNEGIVESERSGFHVNFSFNRDRMSQIADRFERMVTSIQSRCDQQMIRDQNLHSMNICFIYYSYSGVTRQMIAKIHAVCGGDIIEVVPQKKYRTFTVYTTGCIRSRQEEPDVISPAYIDVSGYDLIVIGTPVWAWKPAPAIHAAVAGLVGCAGKKVVIVATYSNNPGDCIPTLSRWLHERDSLVISKAGFSKRESEDPVFRNDLIEQIIDAYRV